MNINCIQIGCERLGQDAIHNTAAENMKQRDRGLEG